MTLAFRGPPPGRAIGARDGPAPDLSGLLDGAPKQVGAARIETDWRTWHRAIWPAGPDPDGWAEYHAALWDWAWGTSAQVDKLTSTHVYKPYVAVWPRGWGKCLAGTSEVLLADGRRRPIQDISVGDMVIGLEDVAGRLVPARVSQRWESGEQPCIRVTTRSGWQVVLTQEHRVRAFEGWVPAGALGIGSRIASPRRATIAPTETARSDAEVRMLAYMVAEGSTSSGSAGFTNADAAIVQDFIQCAQALRFTVTKGPRYSYRLSTPLSVLCEETTCAEPVHGRGLCRVHYWRWKRSRGGGIPRNSKAETGIRAWLRGQELYGSLSKDKRIPGWVFGLPERQRWMFLAAMIDTDGWVAVNDGKLGITLASPGLIKDLRHLFLSVGVPTAESYKDNGKAGAWRLLVDQDALIACRDNLPLLLKGPGLARLCETSRYSLLDTYPPSAGRGLPKGLNRSMRASGLRVGNKYAITRPKMRAMIATEERAEWRWLEEADVWWDEVIRIEDAGECETYDIEVEGVHSLIADGIVSHNSHHAERVAVMLGATGRARYCLYVSNTQEQADDHVSSIASHMEGAGIERYCPGMGERAVNKYGSSRGWRRNRLRTASGYTVDALGMDRAIRGVKLDDDRPDLIILDDVDSEDDGQTTLDRKRVALTRRILPAGNPAGCAVLVAQTLTHPNGIVAQLVDGRADYLADRIVSGPWPALTGLTWEGSGRDAVLTGGTPTWAERGLDVCQGIVTRIGLRAFLAELQHDVQQVGMPRFDREAIRVQAAGCRPPLPQDALPEELHGVTGLSVWALPRPGVPYVIYTDPAEGKGRDYTATVVLEARTFAHVATLRDNTREPSQHAALAVRLAHWYNVAFAGWESNKGEQVSYVYGTEGYPRLYWYTPEASLQQRMAGTVPARHLGFPVTGQTRPGLIEDLAVAIESYALSSMDEALWKEANAFILTANGRAESAPGSHDDLVMAAAGALRLCREPGAQRMQGDQPKERRPIRWGGGER